MLIQELVGGGGGEGELREGAGGGLGGSKHDHALLDPASGDDIRGVKMRRLD